MAHSRARYLKSVLSKALMGSPIVGVLGQRQTGKTTLVEKSCQEYSTLDDEEQLELAQKSAKTFILDRKSPFAIDECQLSSSLFPALKERIRTHPRPNQYLLTGSVRFTSVEEIKESLTGRMIDLELLPLTITEAERLPLTDIHKISRLANPLEYLKKQPLLTREGMSKIESYLTKGGLPGICFIRDGATRIRKMRSHIKTILDRDLRMVIRTELDYLTLKTFLEEIATQQGEVFDLSKAARGARISINSAKKLLSGFESVFLVRSLRKTGLTTGKLIYFEDQGMATFLLQERGILTKSGHLRVGDYNRILFQQVFAQLNYSSGLQYDLFTYRTKTSAGIDFVAQVGGAYVGYCIGTKNAATPSQIANAEAFLKEYPGAKVLLLHFGGSYRQLADRIFEVPFVSVI